MAMPQEPDRGLESSDEVLELLDDLEKIAKNSLMDIAVLFGRQLKAQQRAAEASENDCA